MLEVDGLDGAADDHGPDARVVEQHVEPTERGEGHGDDGGTLLRAGEIRDHGRDLPVRRAHRLDRGRQRVLTHIREDEPRTRLREEQRARAADAGRGPGDDRDLPVEGAHQNTMSPRASSPAASARNASLASSRA